MMKFLPTKTGLRTFIQLRFKVTVLEWNTRDYLQKGVQEQEMMFKYIAN